MGVMSMSYLFALDLHSNYHFSPRAGRQEWVVFSEITRLSGMPFMMQVGPSP